MIAVHCGAGQHSSKLRKEYNILSNSACKKAITVLSDGGTALEAVKVAISVLENDPLTNAGYGSNLTYDGEVECDASVMDGTTLTFGGCGAVSKLQNPIELAYTICINQRKQSPIGLVPPLLLAGKGGLKYARKNGLKIVNSKRLISAKALRQHQKYKKVLDSTENNGRMDTVGAVCLDGNGHVATGSSSGGLILKQAGRVGQAALFGSSCWADSCDLKEPVIAVCTTGCGEQLIKTQLAKEIADGLKFVPNPTESLHGILREKFLESRILRGIEQKLGGALVLHENSGEVSVLWAHSTETMSVGFMKLTDKKPRSTVSELPNDCKVGESVNIGGTYFYINKEKNNETQ